MLNVRVLKPLNGYYIKQVAGKWKSKNLSWKCRMDRPA